MTKPQPYRDPELEAAHYTELSPADYEALVAAAIEGIGGTWSTAGALSGGQVTMTTVEGWPVQDRPVCSNTWHAAMHDIVPTRPRKPRPRRRGKRR